MKKKRGWSITRCRKCTARACHMSCSHWQSRQDYVLGRKVKQAQRELCLLSPRDDQGLIRELKGSRQVELVSVMDLPLPEPVKYRLLQRGFTLAAFDGDGNDLEPELPIGIFSQAAEESIIARLWETGRPLGKLQMHMDFGSGHVDGAVTEDDFWSITHDKSIYREKIPMFKAKDRLVPGWKPFPTEHALEEQLDREARFAGLTEFLKLMFNCAVKGFGPAVVLANNGFRFQYRNNYKLLMNQDGWQPLGRVTVEENGGREIICISKELAVRDIRGKLFLGMAVKAQKHVARSVTVGYSHDAAAFMEALWAYLWWRRRQWLQAHPDKVWLSETNLSAVRGAFRQMCMKLELPRSKWPKIKEEYRRNHLQDLQARLDYLANLETRTLTRLNYLQETNSLDEKVLTAAADHLDWILEEQEITQSRLETAILFQAKEFYGTDFLGYDILQAKHTPDELSELQAEMLELAAG